jgi:hypothetical protein
MTIQRKNNGEVVVKKYSVPEKKRILVCEAIPAESLRKRLDRCALTLMIRELISEEQYNNIIKRKKK